MSTKTLGEKSANTLARKTQPTVTPMQDKNIRLSVDIAPTEYRRLISWCQDIAPAVGRVKVNHVWVIRALVRELWADKELMKRVIDRVRDENPKNP